MIHVNLYDLVCASVIEIARERASLIAQVDLGFGDPPIEVVQIADVLYLPSVLQEGQSLQIVDSNILPIEAVLYEFTAEFVKARLSTAHRHRTLSIGTAAEEIDGDVCVLGNVFSRNFTHWHEELMKVLVLERAGIQCKYVLSNLPQFSVEFLALIGIDEKRIVQVDKPTVFRSALFNTAVSYQNLSVYPGLLQALREALLAVDDSSELRVGARVWLHRNAQARLGRRLVNDEEVHKCLDKYSIQPLDFGALPLRTQITSARHIEVMSGIHGSHFVHSQLMKNKSTVIECFSPLYLNPTYTEIYRVLKHRYCQITGANTPIFPYKYGTDVEVDCAQLELAFQASS